MMRCITIYSPCHPGPCPPCLLSVEKSCHCGQELLVNRCSKLQESPHTNASLSCGRICSKPLSCKKHVCMDTCHPGACSPCKEMEKVKCYCGKEMKEVKCGEGEARECAVMDESEESGMRAWEGRYECENECGQSYSCGVHSCDKVGLPSSTRINCNSVSQF